MQPPKPMRVVNLCGLPAAFMCRAHRKEKLAIFFAPDLDKDGNEKKDKDGKPEGKIFSQIGEKDPTPFKPSDLPKAEDVDAILVRWDVYPHLMKATPKRSSQLHGIDDQQLMKPKPKDEDGD